MTDQERLEAFAKAYQALTEQFGVTLTAVPNIRQYGNMIQIDEPTLQPALIKDWTPPDEPLKTMKV